MCLFYEVLACLWLCLVTNLIILICSVTILNKGKHSILNIGGLVFSLA
jgi:hypothetical protein